LHLITGGKYNTHMAEIISIMINLLFGALIFYLTIAFITGAPYVPSTKNVALKMIELANIKKGMIVYDLGSGDGRLLFLASKKGANAHGFEINPYLVIFTKLKILISNQKNISVSWKNFWHADFSDADVLFVYLLPWKMKNLSDLIKNQVKPGTLVVSNSFIFPDLTMIKKDDNLHVYLFRV
jgi:hypothetical protein